ncbi:MAG: DNA repair protein RadC [Chlorobiaceae bacterium]|nr:DNA repair protein RadC [Chlorobiaceae bacterium]
MTPSRTTPIVTPKTKPAFIPQYYVKLMKETQFQYEHNKIIGAKMVYDLLQAIGLHEKAQEEFYSFYLNTKNRVIGMEMISRGTLNATLIHPREVFKGALLANAHAVILAHNHPSGDVEPSNADKNVTTMLVDAGNLLDVKVLDHVIIGSKGGYFSFRESSML